MNKEKFISKNVWVLLIPALFFIFDRIFKNIALKNITTSNFLFDFHYVANSGVSWGLLKGNSGLLLWISVIIVGVLLYFYKDLENVKLGTNLILIGAISNIFDRVLFGHIVDYIDFRFFPVFNIADACIVLGGIYIILWFLFFEKKKG